MTWALSTETAQSKKKRKRNPETLPSICLESLNVFASKTIKGLFVLFPSAKSTCGFIGFHSWDNRGNVSSKKKKVFYSEAGEPKISCVTPSLLTLS